MNFFIFEINVYWDNFQKMMLTTVLIFNVIIISVVIIGIYKYVKPQQKNNANLMNEDNGKKQIINF